MIQFQGIQKLLKHFSFYMGLIERWESGTTRMTEELQQAGLPAPNFEYELGHFQLIFYKQLFSQELLKEEGLSQRQLLAIKYVKEHETISTADFQTVAGISRRTAARELNELKLKGIFVSEIQKGRGVFYQLNEPNEPKMSQK